MSGESTHYRAYGLTVRSELSLPELRPADANGESADVVVRTGDVESARASGDDAKVNTARFSSVGAFAVVGGREVVCDLDTSGLRAHRYARRVVCTEVLPVVLLQRGSLVIHASAVAVDGRAAVFLGAPGTGKSTIAAAFHRAGCPVLADDIVGLRLDDERPSVLPGVPQLRLDAAAVTALEIDEAEVSTRPGSESRYLSLTPTVDAVPVGSVYVLVEGEPVAIDPVTGAEQFFQVVRRTFHDGFLSGVDVTPAGFEQISAVIDASPVRFLCRPTRYDALPTAVDAVTADLAGEEPSSR